MIVCGYEVKPEQIEACLARMRKCPFEAWQIASVAHDAGVTIKEGACDRLADRLIQRERKAGTIVLHHRLWVPAGYAL